LRAELARGRQDRNRVLLAGRGIRKATGGGALSPHIVRQPISGATPNEVEALDALSRQAEKDLAETRHDLGDIVAMIQDAMAEVEVISAGKARQ